VAGDAALMVDPYNVSDIADAIDKIVTNNELRNELVDKGYKNIQRFSWDSCAQKTLKTLRQYP
jgi:glycosyltransferase involved in cell wall biosynthesis